MNVINAGPSGGNFRINLVVRDQTHDGQENPGSPQQVGFYLGPGAVVDKDVFFTPVLSSNYAFFATLELEREGIYTEDDYEESYWRMDGRLISRIS